MAVGDEIAHDIITSESDIAGTTRFRASTRRRSISQGPHAHAHVQRVRVPGTRRNFQTQRNGMTFSWRLPVGSPVPDGRSPSAHAPVCSGPGCGNLRLRVFRKLCSRDALKKVYLTTMWDELGDPMVGERRLNELKSEFWKETIGRGAHIAHCRIDDGSPRELVRRLILDAGRVRKALLIQQEIVELKKELGDTAAGHQLYIQLEDLAKKQMEVLRKIGEKSAASDANANALAELQAEYDALRVEIDEKLR